MLQAAYSNVRLPSKGGLQMYYGSIHDVLSYPCEVGIHHPFCDHALKEMDFFEGW
jgi:hypothetical protein